MLDGDEERKREHYWSACALLVRQRIKERVGQTTNHTRSLCFKTVIWGQTTHFFRGRHFSGGGSRLTKLFLLLFIASSDDDDDDGDVCLRSSLTALSDFGGVFSGRYPRSRNLAWAVVDTKRSNCVVLILFVCFFEVLICFFDSFVRFDEHAKMCRKKGWKEKF